MRSANTWKTAGKFNFITKKGRLKPSFYYTFKMFRATHQISSRASTA